MPIKPKAKSKPMPAKKPVPSKSAPVKAAAKPAIAKRAVQRDIEDPPADDGTLDIVAVLAGCPTATLVDALLAEMAKRVDFVIEAKDETPEEIAALWVDIKRLEQHQVNV